MSKSGTNIQYSPEEQELIDILAKDSSNLERAAQLLIANIGNMEFNDKLRRDSKEQNAEEKKFLSYFTYKTKNYDQSKAVLSKLDIILQSKDRKLSIEDYEKLTLAEYNKISDLQSINKLHGDMTKMINDNCNCLEFKELFTNIKKSSNRIEELNKQALLTKDYKSGDIMMYLTEKTAVVKGRQNLSGHEGKLEELFLTKYNHAAPLYVYSSRSRSEQVTAKSDVWNMQRSDKLRLEEILESDTFRVDPTKLVSKKQIKNLTQIDYGYKRDKNGEDILDDNGKKVKETWQNVMRERYEQLSYALHVGQLPAQIVKLKDELIIKKKEYKELEVKRGKLYGKIKQFEGDVNVLDPKELKSQVEVIKEYNKLRAESSIKKDELKELRLMITTKKKEYKKSHISNDAERLDSAHWLNPKTILKGHTQWFSDNNFRDLSKKMFNASPDQKMMICSEFASRSIASVMDQLNRITSLDLQATELIDKEERVIRELIPKSENFTNLHPERLAQILEESGSVSRVRNKFLQEFILTEETAKKVIKDKEYSAILPRKIYSLLEKSINSNDFREKSHHVLDIYLSEIRVKRDLIKQSDEMIKKNLDEIYIEYKKKPETMWQKICSFVNSVLEFCKLRTKDKEVKYNIGNLIKEIKTATKDLSLNRNKVQLQQLAKNIGDNLTKRQGKRGVNVTRLSNANTHRGR